MAAGRCMVVGVTAGTDKLATPGSRQPARRRTRYDTPKGIRGIDRKVWARFKKAARVQNRPVGEMINEILDLWLDVFEANTKRTRS